MEVTTEPLPDISERSPISLRTRARARWGADAGYKQPELLASRPQFLPLPSAEMEAPVIIPVAMAALPLSQAAALVRQFSVVRLPAELSPYLVPQLAATAAMLRRTILATAKAHPLACSAMAA
jgi:hypothetical protein